MSIATYTEMCLFTTHNTEDDGKFEVRYGLPHAFNKMDSPVNAEPLRIQYKPETDGSEEIEVMIHYSPATGHVMGAKYNKWFSERLGYDVRLVYIGENKRKVLGNMPPNIAGAQMAYGTTGEGLENMSDKERREVGPPNGGNGWLGSLTSSIKGVVGSVLAGNNKENEVYDGEDNGIGFSEVAPYLVINTKSWEDAQRRLNGEDMDITKFRPNIIVEGAIREYEEDFWAEVMVGDAKFVLTQNCARCNSLNVDYNTGRVAEGESGKMLKKLQSDRRVDLGAKYSPVFGRYGFLTKADGRATVEMKVGDQVEVVRRSNARTRFGKCTMKCQRNMTDLSLQSGHTSVQTAERIQ